MAALRFEPNDMISFTEISIIAIAVFGSAVIKNSVGIGAGIFLLPFLALVISPKLALGLGAPAMFISDIVGVRNYWGKCNYKELAILVPLAAGGVVLGMILIQMTPDHVFKKAVGGFAVFFSSWHIIKIVINKNSVKKTDLQPSEQNTVRGCIFTAFFGFLAGIASTVAHAGGLTISIYMLEKKASPRVFVGTLVFFFALINLFKIGAYYNIGIINREIVMLVLALSPIIIFGGVIGNEINKRFSQEYFRLIVLVIIFCIGGRLFLTA